MTYPQATAFAPLVTESPRPSTGEVRFEGLIYRILEDGTTVALVGCEDTVEGDIEIPDQVASGAYIYDVVAIACLNQAGIFANLPVSSLSLPATIETIEEGALAGCESLERIEVSPENETFDSRDGVLCLKEKVEATEIEPELELESETEIEPEPAMSEPEEEDGEVTKPSDNPDSEPAHVPIINEVRPCSLQPILQVPVPPK